MKNLAASALTLLVLGFLLTVGALAQQAPANSTTRDPTIAGPATPGSLAPVNEVYVSKLIGASVKNTEGESLGTIQELVLDPADARIKSAVISMGGLLGIGAKSIAIPWQEVQRGSWTDKDTLVVAIGKEELQQAPEWRPGGCPGGPPCPPKR